MSKEVIPGLTWDKQREPWDRRAKEARDGEAKMS